MSVITNKQNVLIFAAKDISQNRRVPLLGHFFADAGYTVHIYAYTRPHPDYNDSRVDVHLMPTQIMSDRVLNWMESTEGAPENVWRPRFGSSKLLGLFIGVIEVLKYKLRRPIGWCVHKFWGDENDEGRAKVSGGYAHILRKRFGSKISDKRRTKFNRGVKYSLSSGLVQDSILVCHDRFSAPLSLTLSKVSSHIIFDIVELFRHRTRESLEGQSARQSREIAAAEALLDKAVLLSVGPSVSRQIAKDFPIHEVYNGRPLAQWAGGRQERDPCRLAFSGAFFPNCGLEHLLGVCAHMPKAYELILVGHFSSAQYRAKIMKLIASYDLSERVAVTEDIKVDEVHLILSTAQAYILPFSADKPNLQVSMPNRLFDAIAAGLPIFSQKGLSLTQWVEEKDIGTSIDITQLETCAQNIRAELTSKRFNAWKNNLEGVFQETAYERQMEKLRVYLQDQGVI